jgi:iron(III) transport system ATP-binding protein
MKDGSMVEIGTPKKIYFDSDHRFVADFIGRANLINGKVTAFENSYTIVDSSMGTIACQKSPKASVGDVVTLCIRPEFIKVLEKDTIEGSNIFRGRVESLLFVGEAYEGEIVIADTRLITRIEPTTIVEEGDEVSLYFDPSHCFVLSK